MRPLWKRFLAGLFLACALAVPLRAAEALVFAAASLSDAMKELGKAYESQGGAKVSFNFAGSNLLARQILEGAPADLFASADEAQMDRLARARAIDLSTRVSLLSNRLVAVAPVDSPLAVSAPTGLAASSVGRIAMADPRAVPNGVYARQYFERIGLWRKLLDKVIPTENVRGSLQAVESGHVDAAVVYRSDVHAGKKLRVLFEVPKDEGPPIRYPFAVVQGARQAVEAAKFLAFLSTDAALDVFLKHGFLKAERP